MKRRLEETNPYCTEYNTRAKRARLEQDEAKAKTNSSGKLDLKELPLDVLTIIFSYLSNKRQYRSIMFVNKLFCEMIITYFQRPELNSFAALKNCIKMNDHKRFSGYIKRGCNITEHKLYKYYSSPFTSAEFVITLFETFKRELEEYLLISNNTDDFWSRWGFGLFGALAATHRVDLMKEMLEISEVKDLLKEGRERSILTSARIIAWSNADSPMVEVLMDSMSDDTSYPCWPDTDMHLHREKRRNLIVRFFDHPRSKGFRRDSGRILRFAALHQVWDVVEEILKPRYKIPSYEICSLIEKIIDRSYHFGAIHRHHIPYLCRSYINRCPFNNSLADTVYLLKKLSENGYYKESIEIMKTVDMTEIFRLPGKRAVMYHNIENNVINLAINMVDIKNNYGGDQFPELIPSFEKCFGIYAIEKRCEVDHWSDIYREREDEDGCENWERELAEEEEQWSDDDEE